MGKTNPCWTKNPTLGCRILNNDLAYNTNTNSRPHGRTRSPTSARGTPSHLSIPRELHAEGPITSGQRGHVLASTCATQPSGPHVHRRNPYGTTVRARTGPRHPERRTPMLQRPYGGAERTGTCNWRQQRHNAIRDLIAKIARQAGLQIAVERDMSPGVHPGIRADVILYDFPRRGTHTAVDVIW